MSRTATIESLPQAFEVIKQMQDQGYDWGEAYRRAGHGAGWWSCPPSGGINLPVDAR